MGNGNWTQWGVAAAFCIVSASWLAACDMTDAVSKQTAGQQGNSDVVKAIPEYAIWIDVRTPQEYLGGHLDGAVNIPHTQVAQRIAEVTADKNAEINLYCRSGRRSGLAVDILKQMGYTNVHNRGGYGQLMRQTQ